MNEEIKKYLANPIIRRKVYDFMYDRIKKDYDIFMCQALWQYFYWKSFKDPDIKRVCVYKNISSQDLPTYLPELILPERKDSGEYPYVWYEGENAKQLRLDNIQQAIEKLIETHGQL